MTRRPILILGLAAALAGTALPRFATATGGEHGHKPSVGWTEVQPSAPWSPRAGLKVVSLGDRFYLMGGRTPNPPSFPPVPGDSVIWGDVWTSRDRGSTWNQLLASDEPGHWAPRAYFGAVTKGKAMYVLGGQDFAVVANACPPFVPDCPPFVSRSTFFNDVWRSRDGVRWTQMTDHAPWAGRAGLSSVVLRDEIYVFGGSQNDDSAVIGGPPQRIYFNDVWKSGDGRTWEKLVDHAPWSPRAGAAAVTKGGYIYLLGGENGFVCEPLPFCTPPYFNDVWRTRDGVAWELVTPAAGWSPRPGHACVVAAFHIVCFGGFGLLENPVDMWASFDGSRWVRLPTPPWNATSPDQIKYDFAALSVAEGIPGVPTAIYTFGGDWETFDFTDPTNYLRVDNDVWRYGLIRP